MEKPWEDTYLAAAAVGYGFAAAQVGKPGAVGGGNPKDLTLKAGETKELGELPVKPME